MRLTNKQTQQPTLHQLATNQLAIAIKQHSLILCTASALIMTISISPFASKAQAALTINGNAENYNQHNGQQVQKTFNQYKQKYNQYQNSNSQYQDSQHQYNQRPKVEYKSPSNNFQPYNPTYSSTSNYDNSTNYFEDARQAANSKNDSSLYDYEQRMQGGLFAMYPEYWRLSNNMNSLPASMVISFAKRYPNSVMAEKLVADFAESKAKSGDYTAVQQVSKYIQNPDNSEACAVAIGNVHGLNSTRLQEQKDKIWLNTLKQPALCDQLAMVMNNSTVINNTDRKNRLYRMLREGKTGQIMALAGNLGTPINYADLQNIQSSQNNFLNQFTSEPYSEKNQYLYLYAMGKMAEKSYNEVAMQLKFDIREDNHRRQHLLSEDTRRMAYRTLGVARMNMNTDDGFSHDAVDWFRDSFGMPFNYEEAEDYAMAGIRFNEWEDVINAITAMDNSRQQEPIWQYWLARSYEQTGNKRKAKSIYKKVAKQDDYYAFLSKDRIGERISLSSMGGSGLPNISPSQRSNMMKNQHFSRAFALYSVNESYARREWNWGVKQAINSNNKGLLLAAARHAHDIGWLDRSIYALEKGKEKFGLINATVSHPMPRKNAVIRYSQRVGIDPAWAYGIMRQESRFNVSAKSGVGASGLMQIMPGTGKYIARKLGESYNASLVNSGDTNIRYGTWYMSDIKDELGGQPVLATAGYNAGPSKAVRWQPSFGNISADQYVETIPYPETRNYVKHVMENATVYGAELGNPQGITQRMGTIYPKY